MLNQQRQLDELYNLKHFNDSDDDFVDYEGVIFDKSVSPYVFQNDMMKNYLDSIKPLAALWFDRVNEIKNYKNYIVEKDYYKHKN